NLERRTPTRTGDRRRGADAGRSVCDADQRGRAPRRGGLRGGVRDGALLETLRTVRRGGRRARIRAEEILARRRLAPGDLPDDGCRPTRSPRRGGAEAC